MMNADRDTNRLPLRAGAMLLFAVAIVFIGLGWHSAATSGNDPEAALQAAQASAPATTSSAPASSTAAASDVKICVVNAGQIAGLAGEVADQLKEKGFTTQKPSNYTRGGFSENTIVYSEADQKDEAQKIADALSGDASVESRDNLGSSFAPCQGGIAVVVVSR